MSVDRAKKHLEKWNKSDSIMTFDVSSATVELAAAALGVTGARIAKTLSFKVGEKVILILAAGDTKIDNRKFRGFFGTKAKMLGFDEVEPLVGHEVGGVCPFGINDGIDVYLDISLKRFDTVFPAAGGSNTAIEMTCDELEVMSGSREWIDVCTGW